jgi:hypothetical protein
MSNVLFIYQDARLPSSRIRVLNLLPEIRKEGIQASAVSYPKSFSERIRLLRKTREFDVVYLQKKLLSPLEMRILRKFARKLFFDFDDAIYCRNDVRETLKSGLRDRRFKNIVQTVDLVVAGNGIGSGNPQCAGKRLLRG